MREDAFGRDASKLHIEDTAMVGAGNVTINFGTKAEVGGRTRQSMKERACREIGNLTGHWQETVSSL